MGTIMRILILGNDTIDLSSDRENYYAQIAAFFRQAAPSDLIVEYALLSQLLFEVNDEQARIYDTRNQHDLADYQAVFMRGLTPHRSDMAYAISVYLSMQHKTAVNDYSQIRAASSSKLGQAFSFMATDLPTPHTLSGFSQVLHEHCRTLELPFVCKDVHGSHGSDNYLIERYEDLEKVFQKHPNQLFVLQEFIANDGDYRVLFVGRRHLIIKRSSTSGSHLNNTSQRGQAELLPEDALPSSLLMQARRHIGQLGMTIAGVDIIYDVVHDRYLFLEVNAQPQLVTGAFVAEKQKLLANYLSDLSAEA